VDGGTALAAADFRTDHRAAPVGGPERRRAVAVLRAAVALLPAPGGIATALAAEFITQVIALVV